MRSWMKLWLQEVAVLIFDPSSSQSNVQSKNVPAPLKEIYLCFQVAALFFFYYHYSSRPVQVSIHK